MMCVIAELNGTMMVCERSRHHVDCDPCLYACCVHAPYCGWVVITVGYPRIVSPGIFFLKFQGL